MAKKQQAAQADPTLGSTEIVLGGVTYKMCLDLGALAEAETALRAKGHNVNLLLALPDLSLASTMVVFAASLQRFHPKLEFAAAKALVTRETMWEIATAIAKAWNAAKPEAAKGAPADPPTPGR